MARLPVFFLSHGAPDLILSDHPARYALESLAKNLDRPRAILCLSPHWQTSVPTFSTSAAPVTIHDFFGFPAPLYELRYPAPGEPRLAAALAKRLANAGIEAATADRGMDHGVWAPLYLAFPEADIPVVSMSLPQGWGAPAYHRLGKALAPLRDEGVLIVASGTATHNLAAMAPEGTPPAAWSERFQDWLLANLRGADTASLLDWKRQAPHARQAHPTSEHLDPLWVAWGAAEEQSPEVVYQGFTYGSVGMVHLHFGHQLK